MKRPAICLLGKSANGSTAIARSNEMSAAFLRHSSSIRESVLVIASCTIMALIHFCGLSLSPRIRALIEGLLLSHSCRLADPDALHIHACNKAEISLMDLMLER